MPITRTFLDWNRPALPAVVDWLLDKYGRDDAADLGNVSIVVPGGRAGRRLQELLVIRADERGLVLIPPEVVTLGALPERLYVEQKPFANDLVQHLAWIDALQTVDRGAIAPYFPHLPDRDDFLAWQPFAEMLARLHKELAADGLNFEDVVERGGELDNFPEEDRWRVLRRVQEEYLSLLDRLGVWDKQTARLVAIDREECRPERDIVLVGTVDMNVALRQMIDQVADRVTAVVFAPRELVSRFDEHGCLKPNAWPHAMVELDDERIRIVARPGDQADEVLRALAELGGEFPAEEIVVGVPDQSLVPYVEQRLESAGIAARYGVGREIGQTLTGKLLVQIADWLEEGSAAEFQNLLRHPLIEDYLAREQIQGDWNTEADQYRQRHLQPSFGKPWLGTGHGLLEDVSDKVSELLGGWRYERLLLTEWPGRLVELMSRLCDGAERSVSEQREELEIARAVRGALEAMGDVPTEMVPEISGSGFLRLVLSEIAKTPVPAEADPNAVELLGWLELPWDDAGALIVTGMNEGIVPSSRNEDLFLPNSLRHLLQIEDNDRRFARDAYALSLLAASQESLVLIAGKVTANNDPLTPSRLLFGNDEQTMVRRTLRFFEDQPSTVPAVPGRLTAGSPGALFQPPRLDAYFRPVESMRVTEFRDYLQCPYRYFLRHRLKLKSVIPGEPELDPLAFGTLCHDVLQAFGRNEELRGATDPEAIVAFLNVTLNAEVKRKHGGDPEPAILIQRERLRTRLHAFAGWQARQVEEGWRIVHAEIGVAREDGASLDVDGVPMPLTGRIDRIDYNERSGVWRIYDYKTSESGDDPRKTHYKPKKEEWVDLQLPLYRHLVKAKGIKDDVELAYINLPRKASDMKHQVAGFSADELLSADEAARNVVRNIRDNVFWPPSTAPGLMSEYAEICLDAIIGGGAEDAEEGA